MKIFCYHIGKELFWFRIFGRGISFDKRIRFSQRNGYAKYIKINDYIISYLKKI